MPVYNQDKTREKKRSVYITVRSYDGNKKPCFSRPKNLVVADVTLAEVLTLIDKALKAKYQSKAA